MTKALVIGIGAAFVTSFIAAPASAQIFEKMVKKVEEKLEKEADQALDEENEQKASPGSYAETLESYPFRRAPTLVRNVATYDSRLTYCFGSQDSSLRRATRDILIPSRKAWIAQSGHHQVDSVSEVMETYDEAYSSKLSSWKSMSGKTAAALCKTDWQEEAYKRVSSYAQFHPRFERM